MTSIKEKIFAGFFGQAWTAILGIIFVPIYLSYVGVESYGLIGIFLSLQAFLNLLDFGVAPTLNREMARLSISERNAQEMQDVKTTLQIPNLLSAIGILLFLCILSPIIANYWINPKELTARTITESFLIISFTTAIQFLSGFNMSGLLGLQKQVLLNGINIICGTIRSVGAWLVLAFFSPTIQSFLLWQLLITILQAILTNIAFRKNIFPAKEKGRFRRDLLHKIWRFAAGMSIIGILALIVIQTDKIVLSKMLTLKDFGYYSLAVTISTMTIGIIVSSITNVIYPKFSILVALENKTDLINYYHFSCQLMSFFLIPPVSIIVFYSYHIVFIWTKNIEITNNTYFLLTLVAIGGGLNGLVHLPYHMQLAHKWTKLTINLLIISIIILVPLMIVGTYYLGAIGGAIGWIIYNSLFGWITVWLMHKQILIGEQWTWLFKNVLPPLISVVGFNLVIYYLINDYLLSINTTVVKLLIIGIIFLVTSLICSLTLSRIRELIILRILKFKL